MVMMISQNSSPSKSSNRWNKLAKLRRCKTYISQKYNWTWTWWWCWWWFSAKTAPPLNRGQQIGKTCTLAEWRGVESCSQFTNHSRGGSGWVGLAKLRKCANCKNTFHKNTLWKNTPRPMFSQNWAILSIVCNFLPFSFCDFVKMIFLPEMLNKSLLFQ